MAENNSTPSQEEISKAPYLLLISGSDSSGGAGMQADIAVARWLGCYPQCAVTCVTAQGAHGLTAIEPVSVSMLRAQLDAALEAGIPAAVKIGLIPNRELAEVVVEFLATHKLENVVVDPVLAPTKSEVAINTDFWLDIDFQKRILPHVALFTPNLKEFTKISKCTVDVEEMIRSYTCVTGLYIAQGEIPEWMRRVGLEYLIITNGDASTETLHEWMFSGGLPDSEKVFITPNKGNRVLTPNTHGTGCTYSTVIACNLMLYEDDPYEYAYFEASYNVRKALEASKNLRLYDDPTAHGPAFFLPPEPSEENIEVERVKPSCGIDIDDLPF